MSVAGETSTLLDAKIVRRPGKAGAIVFGAALLGGALYAGWHLVSDLSRIRASSWFDSVGRVGSLRSQLRDSFPNSERGARKTPTVRLPITGMKIFDKVFST